MKDLPDYRGDKMRSQEGSGNAAARYKEWKASLPADVLDAAGLAERDPDEPPDPRFEEFRDIFDRDAREVSELTGFWVSWHLLGGFEGLEGSGWNRATIYRKVRRFRAVFDQHPDDYKFPWIDLNLDRAWHNQLLEMLGVAIGSQKTEGKS